MVFPVDLEKVDGGLAFKLREGKPKIIVASPLGEPFDMTFEDRPHGTGDRFGGEPRYGNFGEQISVEIARRDLSTETANAYLPIGPEREVSGEDMIYGDHPPIRRPRVVTQNIQLYCVDGSVANEQRSFIAAFVSAWAS